MCPVSLTRCWLHFLKDWDFPYTTGLVCVQEMPGGSTVLSRVADAAARRDFVTKLITEWLPKPFIGRRKQVGELLYRGSRDGMTAAAFHDKCDGKGPTLVLVAGQSKGKAVSVFGGFAGNSWRGHESGKWVNARDSFLFTVSNPFGTEILKMSVDEKSEYAGKTMWCHAGWGPTFGKDSFGVKSSSESRTALFDKESWTYAHYGGTFIMIASDIFTGAKHFVPLEIEVWRVC
jgi:hypothetical protein